MSKNFSSNSFDKSALSTISTFFSSHRILKVNSSTFAEIDWMPNNKVSEIFNFYYKILFEKYRCEYVYKNEIVKQILLRNHSTKAKLYTEVEIYDSKADVVIMNGTSTVYEIKTELDTFDRLIKQLNSYELVFDKIFVVTHSSKLNALIKIIPKYVGILVLNSDGVLDKIREPRSNKKKVKQEFIFNLLHKREYLEIINNHYGYVPNVPPVHIFQECKKLFVKIPPETAHDYMVKALRERRTPLYRENLLTNLPDSLKLIGTNSRLTKRDCEKIQKKLNACYN